MKNFNLEEQEEKALVGILYNHISFGTTLEILGELKEEGIQRLNLLRSIFGKFLKKFNLDKSLTQENYLLLGMKDFIKKSSLEKWSKEENNKHLQNRAKYFLKKYYDK
ncbi:MAG: hypothetical protein A2Z68_00315 [Candidatus Nealsonbacteria bacterium RBG_13_38_11]|uniref:Uncharacterized protein n=1 Tax=Candidatus Nealsonbacteria bacterium RBG_13_38_11 TaxID=1801662 RepID=A0A1G2DXN9_9BACT|nr:MAG: hypothetical protein A2Z68_00315 [Candidatus Nealsonbacteria bacterium RBG_13_38_11]